jgi:hypothetical protein
MVDENTPEEMFNRMMEEKQKMANERASINNPQMSQGQPGQPPALDTNQQTVLNELQNKPVVTGSHPSQVSSAIPTCPQCGLLHPPNTNGKACTNTPSQTGVGSVIDLDMEINKHLVNLKNITVSQIQSKGIKNINKLLQYMTMEMTKLLEGYNE